MFNLITITYSYYRMEIIGTSRDIKFELFVIYLLYGSQPQQRKGKKGNRWIGYSREQPLRQAYSDCTVATLL